MHTRSDRARFSCLKKASSAVWNIPVYPIWSPADVPERHENPMGFFHIFHTYVDVFYTL